MTIHEPPRLATWFLKRLGSTVVEDALVGDLLEAYQKRRSAFWYWKEVILAIGVGASRDAWHHLPVALGSIVTGLFVAGTPIWVMIVTPASTLSHILWLQILASWIVPAPLWSRILAAFLIVFGSAGLGGLLVSVLFRAHRAVAVLSLAAAIVVVGLIVLPNAADLGARGLTFLLVFDVLATIGGGSLIGVRERMKAVEGRSR